VVTAIVPAAGSGRRLGLREAKPFVCLAGKPILIHTLKALGACASVDSIIVAAPPRSVARVERLVRSYRAGKVSRVVPGGRTRTESVRNCLGRLDKSCRVVVIHDGARPLIEAATVDRAVRLAARCGACVVAVPENDTVKEAGPDLVIKRTLDRRRIYRAQTPQAFRRPLIERAYAKAFASGVPSATDDSYLAERAGVRIKILKGSYRNIKITTIEDLKAAEAFLKKRKKVRGEIGHRLRHP
jgi:2-C-methyl-D-erythritol 4-phosphate cytidylyltransferase